MKEKPSIFCFVTPFASPASVKHTEKLIDVLIPNASKLFLVSDHRVKLSGEIRNLKKVYRIKVPTLHYVKTVKPYIWSILLWILKLISMMTVSCTEIIKNRREIDIIICFLGIYYLPILLCGKILRKKVISFEPASDIEIIKKTYQNVQGLNIFLRAFIQIKDINRKLADTIVVESKYIRDQDQFKEFIQKVRVSNLFVKTDYSKKIHSFNLSDEKVVGFMGRLSPEKNVLSLLEAMKFIKDIRLIIVGDGPCRDEVENILMLTDVSNIEYRGWQDEDGINRFFNDIDLFLLPSENEGMPNALLEAMAAGIPALSTAVGGVPDIISDQVTGYILPNCRPFTIAKYINLTFQDSNLSIVARKGQDLVTLNYSLSASVNKWKYVFNELLSTNI